MILESTDPNEFNMEDKNQTHHPRTRGLKNLWRYCSRSEDGLQCTLFVSITMISVLTGCRLRIPTGGRRKADAKGMERKSDNREDWKRGSSSLTMFGYQTWINSLHFFPPFFFLFFFLSFHDFLLGIVSRRNTEFWWKTHKFTGTGLVYFYSYLYAKCFSDVHHFF